MRGTSRREDSAFWIIKLEREAEYIEAGCTFLSRFEKNRNSLQDPDPYIWTFKREPSRGESKSQPSLRRSMI